MDNEPNSRRRLLQGAALLSALTAVPVVIWSRQALAESGLKANFHYQDTPRGSDKCVDCTAYVDGAGACKILKDSVSANGWCMAFSRKASAR